jgi:cyclopropane fatty-acyl-phospholipid synthase-like methyltransferase
MDHHRPPVPIPPEWYDEDYFEKGTKSNWTNGYSWESFERLFRATAKYLVGLFPDATSALDVGCAKGFLVRALQELGKDCWGIDHSAWALEGAAQSVKPFLLRAGVDDFRPERLFDLVLAFDLLPHLTEEQAEAFLRRARAWTRTAIMATIACSDADGGAARPDGCVDHDLSHITMRPRAFWHGLFLRAGWQQDGLHRVAAQACQEHELPRSMGWRVFVYAPGAGATT